MDAAVIRQGELVGRGVMAYETTEEVGTVVHLLVDVRRSHVVGLTCKTGGLIGRKQSLNWDQLVNIGRDSLIVKMEAAPDFAVAGEADLAAAQDMTGLEVWTDGGDRIGHIVDFCLNLETGEVQQYLFALDAESDSLLQPAPEPEEIPTDSRLDEPLGVEEPVPNDENLVAESVTVYGIKPQAVISAGRKRMMISEAAARQSEPYEQLLNITAGSAQGTTESPINWRPEQLPEMPTDFNELLQKGQSMAGKVTERVRQRAKQFTDEQLASQDFVSGDSLPDITEQLQEKAQQARQQMQSQFGKVRDRAKDQLDPSNLDIDKTPLGKMPFGRSLGKTLGKFKRPQRPPVDPIDVDAFEVWEEDE